MKERKKKPDKPPIPVDELQTILLCVDISKTRKQLAKLSPKNRELVYDWAFKTHLRASDNVVRVPPKPDCI